MPHIYFLSSVADRAMAYPDKLENMNHYTPELIIAWALTAKLNLSIEGLEDSIEHLEASLNEAEEDKSEKNEEHIEELDSHLREAQATLKEFEPALAEAELEFDRLKAQVAESNEFVKEMDEHKEISEMHLTRLEQAHTDEL